MKYKITILGSGTSSGVPRPFVGFGDGVDPHNPKNTRMRVSVLVESENQVILIDTSPDLRQQLLQFVKRPITAVLYTHTHADHCHGIDELRWVCAHNRQPLPVYANRESLDLLQSRFAYCFKPIDFSQHQDLPVFRPVLVPNEITSKPNEPFMVGDVPITPIIQDHGFSVSLGFRIGNFAYSTDVVRLDDTAKSQLRGLDCWVVDALRFEVHPTHAHFDQAIAWISELQPTKAYLTHLNFDTDYQAYRDKCPPNTEPAFDGLVCYSN